MVKKTILIVAIFLNFWQPILAQATDEEKKYTAFDMRNNGKIYVVVAVIVIILTGLIAYLVRLDRKITKLEKEIKQ
jgi:CcmD family protein